ncbi:MAG: leucine-rich repeat domain-containing protein, partial [Lentisphaeria bacterium]|nr:leucine-rich repeat domain-containing protein [Lentisphaeria bacterium]
MKTQKIFLLGALCCALPLTLGARNENESAIKTETNINALREAAEKAGLVLGGDDGRTVVEVRDKEITVVHIPDGVTKIGKGAFSRCSRLLTVTIPDTVTNIGDFAFFDCYRLARVNIPQGVTSIGKGAFSDCYNLGEITIPASVTRIGTRAFSGIKSVRVSAENPVFSIDNRGVLINKKENLIHSATRSISGCYTVPAGITGIGEEAFLLCPQLWHVTIPEGVTTIGKKAFYNNCNLFSVTIPDSVTTIGEEAFAYSENLKLTIPAGVTNIAGNAFAGIKSLKIAAENPVYYVDQHGVLFNKKEKQLIAAPQ